MSDPHSGPEGAPSRPRPILGYRDFRLFFVGNLVSSSGTWLQNVAQGILVLELTGRSTLVGAVQAAGFLPVLLLSLHGGQLADRFDRRRLLIWTQVIATAATAALAVLAETGHASVSAVAAVALVLGVQYAAAIPASWAVAPALVPREDLPAAMGMISLTYNLARALGPAAAAGVVGLVGFAPAFGLNALTFLVLAGAIAAIRPRGTFAPGGGGPVMEGVRYAWRDRGIRSLLAVVAGVSFASDPVYTLAPTFARFVFGRPTADAGLLVSAFGGGAVVAAVALGRLYRAPPRRRWRSGAGGLAVMAGGIAAFALSPSLAAGVVALGIGGVGYLLAITIWTTGIQERAPEALRGRVMALWTLCFLGTRPVAAALDGWLADLASPTAAGLLMLVPLALAAAALPRTGREPAG